MSEELEAGLNAVAAPVCDANSQVVAALSILGPAYRLGAERFEEIAKLTIAAADTISRRLGWIARLSHRDQPRTQDVVTSRHASVPRRSRVCESPAMTAKMARHASDGRLSMPLCASQPNTGRPSS